MKKNNLLCLLTTIAAICLAACSEDSNGWSAKDVCPEDGVNDYGMANRGTFTDERDGQVYKYTTIGDQVWMAQNLNHVAEYSACYDNNDLNCDFWGRLYSLQENGERENPLNYAMVDSICPTGWHVPTIQEWDILVSQFGKYDDPETAKKLKTTVDWNLEFSGGNGTDECGFSVLPGGFKDYEKFTKMYESIFFLTSTMYNEVFVYEIHISSIIRKTMGMGLSYIRCVKD